MNALDGDGREQHDFASKQPACGHRGTMEMGIREIINTGNGTILAALDWGFEPLFRLAGKNDERTRFVALLEIPPVNLAKTAVRVQIVKDVKIGHSK